jgi:hypothetical protein
MAAVAAGCSQPTAASATSPPLDATQSLATPGDTFHTYIAALRKNQFDVAFACLYLPSTNKHEIVRQGFAPLAERIRHENWQLHLTMIGEQGRFAAIIYTTNRDRSDFEPVLAVRDEDGTWKLHHKSLSGGLRTLFTGKEYDMAMGVVNWGLEKVAEFRRSKPPRPPA